MLFRTEKASKENYLADTNLKESEYKQLFASSFKTGSFPRTH